MKSDPGVLDMKTFCEAICFKCKRRAGEHIWRCMECGDPLAKDEDGGPIFDDHHGLFAELHCPPTDAN